MNRRLLATVFTVVSVYLAGAAAPAAVADPSVDPSAQASADQPDQDQVFFDELEREGLHPQYDKQICGDIKCESLRTLLVQEGHAVCVALADSPRLVPLSVIANLQVSPGEAHIIINAARQAYCPQLPDPYAHTPGR